MFLPISLIIGQYIVILKLNSLLMNIVNENLLYSMSVRRSQQIH